MAYTNPDSPASEITGEAAAALAAASMAFNATDPAYAAVLLNHSMALFDLASTYPGSYMNSTDAGAHAACLLHTLQVKSHQVMPWHAIRGAPAGCLACILCCCWRGSTL